MHKSPNYPRNLVSRSYRRVLHLHLGYYEGAPKSVRWRKRYFNRHNRRSARLYLKQGNECPNFKMLTHVQVDWS